MSIASTLRNAVAPKPDADEFAAALDAHHANEREAEVLGRKFTQATVELERKERDLDRAAYAATTGGDDTAYKKLSAEVDALHDERKRLTRAQTVVAEKIAEGRATLDRLGKAGLLKAVNRIANQRTKAVTEMAEHVAGFARTYQKIFDVNAKLSAAWPYGVIPDGALVSVREVVAAIAEELFRVHPVSPLGNSTAPLLPGARYDLIASSPERPLVEKIEAANGYLIGLIEKGPAPNVPATEQPAPSQPAQADKPAGPTFDARTYVPPRRPLNEYLPGGK